MFFTIPEFHDHGLLTTLSNAHVKLSLFGALSYNLVLDNNYYALGFPIFSSLALHGFPSRTREFMAFTALWNLSKYGNFLALKYYCPLGIFLRCSGFFLFQFSWSWHAPEKDLSKKSWYMVFLWVLRYSTLLKNQHYQIPMRPGIS